MTEYKKFRTLGRTYTEASHGYGFVAEDVPELSIAVIASRRHEGIGRRLLVDLIDAP